jgi:hypothetical protein
MPAGPPIDPQLQELTEAVDRAQAALDKHVKFRAGISPDLERWAAAMADPKVKKLWDRLYAAKNQLEKLQSTLRRRAEKPGGE